MTITTPSPPTRPPPPPSRGPPPPPTINVILSFLLVGLAWGFTVPFIRRAARDHRPRHRPSSSERSEDGQQQQQKSWWAWTRLKTRVCDAAYAVLDLLRNPRYAVPLVLNLTGSVWFFLLIGQAELSLTVPVVNTLAFLFTVVGEWWVEGKVISRETMMGMLLSVGGIALCVHSKNTA